MEPAGGGGGGSSAAPSSAPPGKEFVVVPPGPIYRNRRLMLAKFMQVCMCMEPHAMLCTAHIWLACLG